MNREVAKQIGAFPHKDLSKHTEPGSVIIDCSTGTGIVLPKGKKKYDEFCKQWAFRGTYYKVVPKSDKKTYKAAIEVSETEDHIRQLKKELNAAEDKSKKQRDALQSLMLKGSSSIIVIFYTRGGKYVMSHKEVELRKGDKLLSFGRRYGGDRQSYSLWIALIEIPGVLTAGVHSHYSKRTGMRSDENFNSYYARGIKTTGYRPGDEFPNGCSYVTFNNGKPLKTPIGDLKS